jgi:hypothetical protein
MRPRTKNAAAARITATPSAAYIAVWVMGSMLQRDACAAQTG